jgi:hypothetical protein
MSAATGDAPESQQEPAAVVDEVEVRAGGVGSSTPPIQGGGGGAGPTPALQPRDLELRVISPAVAAAIIVADHYLHAMCAGVRLCFGVFAAGRLLGAVALNAGPVGGPRLVDGAATRDCLSLARLWLADDLPRNSESRILAMVVRTLRRHTAVRFLVSYADPAVAPRGVPHVGYVYQAAGWLYTGLSEPQPLFDLGDGRPMHTRSIASVWGTHSKPFFEQHGLRVREVPTVGKHRYLTFVDPTWRGRLRAPVLPYPKTGGEHRGDRRGAA